MIEGENMEREIKCTLKWQLFFFFLQIRQHKESGTEVNIFQKQKMPKLTSSAVK